MLGLLRQQFTAIFIVAGAIAAAPILFAGAAAFAHTVKQLESLLEEKEAYFQPVDQVAPSFTLQDEHGRPVRLADFRGKVVVLHFIYATCPDVCPLHAERLAEVQEMVNQTPMTAQVQFVSITTDPRNDSPAMLRDYGPAHGLDPPNWVFLTTTPDQPEDATRQLAHDYGHKFATTDGNYQVHGVVTHVIDKEGRWRANFHGLEFKPANLVVFINALVNDTQMPRHHGPHSWWDKVKSWF